MGSQRRRRGVRWNDGLGTGNYEERNAVEQLAIAVTGCVAIWLANDQREAWRKWASVFGLAGQPFWFYAAFAAEQWGILALTLVYTASWARGFRNNWMRPNV